MVDIVAKEILVESFKTVFEKVLEKVNRGYLDTTEKRTRLSQALTSINQAILETKRFIKNEGHKDNTSLSKLWLEALNKSIAADLKDGLPDFLYQKANFWGEPQEWLNQPGSMEIVPKLVDLKRLCDNIMVRLNN